MIFKGWFVHLGKQVDKLQPQFTSDVQIVRQFVRPDDLFISSVKTAIKASLCLLMFLVEKRFIFSEGPILHSHLRNSPFVLLLHENFYIKKITHRPESKIEAKYYSSSFFLVLCTR